MSFSDIIGQQAAVASLRSVLKRDAVPHSYLFLGPESVGKTTCAIEFVKALNCLHPAPDRSDPCDKCANCTRIASDQHPDFKRIAPDGEFTRIWQLWSRPGHPPGALETLDFAPVAGRRRIYLFERAETFNDESANSLLKALEEPPSYVQFVLCAPTPSAVLPTILSRCQLIRFGSVPTADIARALREKRGLSEAEAAILAAYAQGAPGRAFRLADDPEARQQRQALLELAARIAASPTIAAFRRAEELRQAARSRGKKGEGDDEERTTRGDLARAIDVLAAWYSDLLALTLHGPNASLVHEDQRTALRDSAARYAPGQIAENIERLLQTRRQIERNANAQLATEVLMLSLVPRKNA